MAEPMPVFVEVWPVAADFLGIWLVSGDDAWRPRVPVMSDSEPHAEVELELSVHGLAGQAALLHSTSWRVDGPRLILTYVAAFSVPHLVKDEFSAALPLALEAATAVGPPPTHAAADPPAPRYIDVLFHAIRHMRFLRDHDATANAALGATWLEKLSEYTPALAGMYQQVHDPTAGRFRLGGNA
jgi:hypothetical protein